MDRQRPDEPEFKAHIITDAEEAPERLSPEELTALFYRQLITPDMIPVPIELGAPPIETVITDAASFEINGNAVMLRGHQLFIWNSLLYLRDREEGMARRDAMALGFAHDAGAETTRASLWKLNVDYLMRKVNEAAGTDVITTTGKLKTLRYHIAPNLRVSVAEQAETRPEGWYEFAQTINGPFLRLSTPLDISAEGDDGEPLHIIIRDNDTIVVNDVAHALTEHRRALLHLLMLNQGKEITYEELLGTGFHPYGRGREARRAMVFRSVGMLNEVLGNTDDDPILSLHVGIIDSSAVILEKNLHVVDIRALDFSIPPLASLRERFDHFKGLVEQPDPVAQAELLFSTRDLSGIPLLNLYVASLRFGITIEALRGTSITLPYAGEVTYEDVLAVMRPGRLNPRVTIKELLHTHRGYIELEEESIAHLNEAPLAAPADAASEEEEAPVTIASDARPTTDSPSPAVVVAETEPEETTVAAQEAPSPIERNNPLYDLITLVEANDLHTRIEQHFSGKFIRRLLNSHGRPTADINATIAHMLPGYGRANQLVLRTALPYVRRYVAAIAPLFGHPDVDRSEPLAATYGTAMYYLGHMVGSPSRGISAVSYSQLLERDPQFAERSMVHAANAWALLDEFAKTHHLSR